MSNGDVKYAGLMVRLFALLIELVTITIVYFIFLYLVLSGLSADSMAVKSVDTVLLTLVFAFISAPLVTLLNASLISKYGGGFGKLVFGLKIRDEPSMNNISFVKAFYRSVFGYTFSSKLFGLGFLKITRDDKKRGWHDDLFETVVVSEKRHTAGYVLFVISILVLAGLIYLNLMHIFNFLQFV
jgi:uncharacterized RDD family membrane protein YckC